MALEGWVDRVAFSQLLLKRTVGPNDAYSLAFTFKLLPDLTCTQRAHLDLPPKDGGPESYIPSLRSELTIKLIALSKHISKQRFNPISLLGHKARLFCSH